MFYLLFLFGIPPAPQKKLGTPPPKKYIDVKKIMLLVLLSALVERVGVSRMRNKKIYIYTNWWSLLVEGMLSTGLPRLVYLTTWQTWIKA